MKLLTVSYLILGAILGANAQTADAAADAALVAKLLTAPTQVQRLALLNDADFVFNFNAGVGVAKGAGGRVISANAGDFPAVIGNGMAMSVGSMEPCGMNTPHTHPRATEFLYVVNGTGLEVGFIEENGARYVTNTVSPGEGTIFPKGSVHFQQNLGCEPLLFIAAFNNVDPGVLSAAQRYFGLPPDVVAASLGDIGVEEVSGLALGIPDNLALGVKSCLDKCKLQRGTQPHVQQQPRVSGNALPGSKSRRSVKGDDAEEPEPVLSKADSASIEDLVFMLKVVVGVMLVGYVGIGATWALRRRRIALVEAPVAHYSDMAQRA